MDQVWWFAGDCRVERKLHHVFCSEHPTEWGKKHKSCLQGDMEEQRNRYCSGSQIKGQSGVFLAKVANAQCV